MDIVRIESVKDIARLSSERDAIFELELPITASRQTETIYIADETMTLLLGLVQLHIGETHSLAVEIRVLETESGRPFTVGNVVLVPTG